MLRSMPTTCSAVLLLVASTGCGVTTTVVGETRSKAPIVQIPLPLSNAYLVQSARPFLVDAASEGDLPALEEALDQRGLKPDDLSAVIVTHAHADHAGMANALKKRGVPVWIGAGDVAQAARGHNDELQATNLMAEVLAIALPQAFPPVTPDRAIDAPVDLGVFGVDGFVAQMPGHTPGSLVVVLDDDKAFVGDQMLGGIFGGALCPSEPGEHYFQADFDRNRENIRRLTRMGIQTFFLGHGGPVVLDDVRDAFGW